MNTSFDIEFSTELLHSENDQTSNTTESPNFTSDSFPSSKRLKTFKECSNRKFYTILYI